LPKKGYKVVTLKEELVTNVRKHLKEMDKGKFFARTIPKFITEATVKQIERERLDPGKANRRELVVQAMRDHKDEPNNDTQK
jgi:hypothetical protein